MALRIELSDHGATMKTAYFFAINEMSVGPLDEPDIKERIALCDITLDTLAWCEGMDSWQPVHTIPELLVRTPVGNWQTDFRIWQRDHRDTQRILDDGRQRQLDAEDRMDEKRSATLDW